MSRRKRAAKVGRDKPAAGASAPPTLTPAATQPTDRTRRARIAWTLAIALSLLTGALFGRSAGYGFILYDDPNYIELNPNVTKGLSFAAVRWAFTGIHHANWHPLTTLSYLIEYQCFGLDPRVFHVTNIVIHALNAGLLLLALKALTGSVWRSALVAAVFAVHPLRVESVVWISERKDVLSGLFWILTLWAYAVYVRRPSVGRYAIVAVCFVLGLMSKPMVVTLPAVLLLLDFWPVRRVRWSSGGTNDDVAGTLVPSVTFKRAVVEKLPLVALSIASSAVTFLVQRISGAVATTQLIDWDVRLANAVIGYVWYIRKTLWPTNLTVFYPLTGELGMWPVALGALLAITALAIWQFRRRPYLLVCWLIYLGTLVPVIGLVQVGDQAVADRYSYIPTIALLVAVVWGAGELVVRMARGRAVAIAGSVAALLALSVSTWRLIGFWRTTETLFTRATTVIPRNAKAHTVLGTNYQLQDRIDDALREYQTAADIRGEYPEAYARIGVCYAAKGDYERSADAIAIAVRQLELPGYAPDVLRRSEVYRDSVYNLAWAEMEVGRYESAERGFRRSIEWGHRVADAHAALATVFNRQQRSTEAVREAEAALAVDAKQSTAHFELGVATLRQGELERSAEHFREDLKRNPTNANAYFQLGNVLARMHRNEEAVAALREAVRLRPQDGASRLKLGVALQAQGEIEEAIEAYRAAMSLGVEAAANNLAWVRATFFDARFRSGAEAVELCEQLLKSAGRRAEILDTLAAGYAETGDFTKAVATAEEALKRSEEAGQSALTGELRERLELYRANKPYRAPPAVP